MTLASSRRANARALVRSQHREKSPIWDAGTAHLAGLTAGMNGRRIDSPQMRGSPVVESAPAELRERAPELAALGSQFENVRSAGTGCFCILAGEAGVGKTALVRRFSEQQATAEILWGACDPLFTPRPLGPLVDIAAAVQGELARLIGSRARPYEVAAALLDRLRQHSPAIVVLEDVHWADEATLDVIRLLSRRIKSVPALLIASYRDDELDRSHPLRVLLGELPREESIVRVKLQPLSAAAVAAMAGPIGLDSEDLYRKTRGNPFFVTEVLAAAGDEKIPSTVRDAVLARAARLSPDARSFLDMVAVAPPEAELWLLESVSGENFSALGQCLSSGMLAQKNNAVAFRHELARLAIEESISADRALQLHRRTLSALARPPYGSPDLARLAHHAEAARDPHALLRFGRAAGERASALGAHREAAAQFSRALGAVESIPSDEHADLLQQLAHEYLHTNQAGRGILAQQRAIELYRQADDTLKQGDALRRQSRLLLCGGRGAEAEAPIRQAIALLEELPAGRELALAHAGLAMYHMNHDEAEGTVIAAQRALELAERIGDTEAILHTLNSLGTLELMTGDLDGKEKLLRSLSLAQEMDNDENVGRAYINLTGGLLRMRAYDGLPELLSQGIEFCLEHGLELWRMWLICCQAQVMLDQGDWSRAVESATAVLQGDGTQLPRVSALPLVALVRARRGDPEVWPLLDEARAMARRQGVLQYAVPVSLARAEVAWLEGRPDAIRQETEGVFRQVLAKDAWWLIGELLCWRRRAGIDDQIDPRVPERYRAELRGDWSTAAELWSACGCEYDAALAVAGADDDGLLRQSLMKLQRLGAGAAAAVVARRLRARGVRGISRGPRPATKSNPVRLTVRELEVLDLVHSGMRNAEIANRLFLTPKTVDHHVSAILRKLAVESRTQAAREANRLGLLD